MITRIEAYRYRCFRTIAVDLPSYAILVGPNGTGKTTLLDIPRLIGEMSRDGLERAFFDTRGGARAPRARKLGEIVHCHRGVQFGLALETELPEIIQETLSESLPPSYRGLEKRRFHSMRYELVCEVFNQEELTVETERLYLMDSTQAAPDGGWGADGDRPKSWRPVLFRQGETTHIYLENTQPKRGRRPANQVYNLRGGELGLRAIPADDDAYPGTLYLRSVLEENYFFYGPDTRVLQQASPPAREYRLEPDGRTLPWLARNLQRADRDRFDAWVRHVQTALPNVMEIEPVVRQDDSHAYLTVTYQGNPSFQISSEGLSEGTLRVLALTIVPYLATLEPPPLPASLIVEQPEDGIHPKAIETVLLSLQSVYDGQVWLSTHSPQVLAQSKLEDLLVFRRDDEGAVQVVSGETLPELKSWQAGISTLDLGALFTMGVLA